MNHGDKMTNPVIILSAQAVIVASDVSKFYILSCLAPHEKSYYGQFLEKKLASSKGFLKLEFDDIVKDVFPYVSPTKEQVLEGLKWAKDRRPLIVHCWAGVSRSSAMALLIAIQSVGLNDGLKVLSPSLHYPNERIIEIGETHFGFSIEPSLQHYLKLDENNA